MRLRRDGAVLDLKTEPREDGTVSLIAGGVEALKKVNRERGLGFDAFDVAYYAQALPENWAETRRTSSSDMSQSNSEHRALVLLGTARLWMAWRRTSPCFGW